MTLSRSVRAERTPPPASARPRTTPRTLVRRTASFVLSVALATAATVSAQPNTSVLEPVPSTRWADLEPRSILIDTTWYDFSYEPHCNNPQGIPYWVQAVATANGKLFAATGNHIRSWSLTNPANPSPSLEICRPTLVPCCQSDTDWYFNLLAVSSDGGALVTAGAGKIGVVVLTSSGSTRYQHVGFDPGNLAIFQNGAGREFVVANALSARIYDLTKALDANCYDATLQSGYTSTCTSETSPIVPNSSIQPSKAMAGIGNFLVIDRAGELKIWDMTDETEPVGVGSLSLFANFDTAAGWLLGDTGYFAGADSQEVAIYSFPLSCDGCTPTLVNTLSTPGVPSGFFNTRVDSLQASVDGERVYLYVGSGAVPGVGPKREWLFDVTDPLAPDDLTPPNTNQEPLHDEENGVGGYWGWYYRDNGGFENIDPTGGVVANGHLMRAARGILDVHALVGDLPPVTGFTRDPSGDVYVGETVTFTDTSTRNPDSWEWDFDFPTGADSSAQNPSFAYAGAPRTATVKLTACAGTLCDDDTEEVVLLDPSPTLSAVTASATAAQPCESVELTAVGDGGRPTLNYDWEILDDGDAVIDTPLGGASLVYAIPGTATSDLRARLSVDNAYGEPAVQTSPVIALTPLDPLALGVDPVSVDQPIAAGLAQFHLTGDTGATRWVWDWGHDGQTSTYVLAAEGRNPTHQFPAGGLYDVTVTISNCVEVGEVSSSPLSVDVPPVSPLTLTEFEPTGLICFAGLCSAFGGSSISFAQTAGGDPDFYDYDWDGDGVWDETSSTPIAAHTYPAPSSGTVTPVARVRRGAEEVTLASDLDIVLEPTATPTVSITGSSALLLDETGTFSAGVTECGAGPSSWSWGAAPDGSVTPSGGDADLTWSVSGPKTVTATAVGGDCDGASTSVSVTVYNATCAQELANGSESGQLVVDEDCLIYLGPNFEVQSTAEVDVNGALVVIRSPFSVQSGGSLSIATTPP